VLPAKTDTVKDKKALASRTEARGLVSDVSAQCFCKQLCHHKRDPKTAETEKRQFPPLGLDKNAFVAAWLSLEPGDKKGGGHRPGELRDGIYRPAPSAMQPGPYTAKKPAETEKNATPALD